MYRADYVSLLKRCVSSVCYEFIFVLKSCLPAIHLTLFSVFIAPIIILPLQGIPKSNPLVENTIRYSP